MGKKINKEKWAKLLANKTQETHTDVMRKIGITSKEDQSWHKEYDGEPADFSKIRK